MTFELDKCRIQANREGHHKSYGGYSIGDLQAPRNYAQNLCKSYLLLEFLRLVKLLLKSYLSGNNKISALNLFAISPLAYAFGILLRKADLINVQQDYYVQIDNEPAS